MNIKTFGLLILIGIQACGQTINLSELWQQQYITDNGLDKVDLKIDFINLDFAPLLTQTHPSNIYGVIGANMQRIQIKWNTVKKDSNNSDTYLVTGKTKVKENIFEFSGHLKINTIRLYPNYDMPYDSKISPQKIGVVFFDYLLIEEGSSEHSGVFKGISATEFYLLNNKLYYNDLGAIADDMTNNQFVGEWQSKKSKQSLICNWGDYRVPNIHDFDCGAAEFVPCEKYLLNGWEDVYKAMVNNDLEAQERELIEWWK